MRLARLLVLIALLLAPLPALADARPIPIKVVVLTAFEVGADTGDRPGEFQAWVERYPLTETMTVPGIVRPVRLSKDGVLGVVMGEWGRARGSIASLVADPRFDLTKAYWIMAGIAGVDPRAGSIGSAAWADWVVDGDPLFELDDREAPADWPWGLYAFGADAPGKKGRADDFSGMVWRLDPGLVRWAYGLTKDISLPDNPQLAADRAKFSTEAAAQTPPRVFVGTSLASVRFWHGYRRTEWARAWVKTWTDDQGTFAMSAGEEQAILDTLTVNAPGGRVDPRRVLVLRTASNYTREGDGEPQPVRFAPGGAEAGFEAAWRVGSPVVRALVAGWPQYADHLPQAAP
ncbi:purine nucleoside permease [Phenylobacterium sp.]|uniref:purine-nucleoside phosphorylase n=1 Tax=Phenylobacterium sp. TaxID=1871053 RepID=UPI0025DAAACA|nr:purine nucleoside permease [Phenylobacterium sp.]